MLSSVSAGWAGVPDYRWAVHQRGKQYRGDHTETYGGVTLNIDNDRFDAPVYLHPAEAPLWSMAHPDRSPDHDLCDGDVLTAGGIELHALTTPGHYPGSTCLYVPELKPVFTGDTLFQGGPGATGRSFSSFDTIIDSIRSRLLTLPGDTQVRTGHGDPTSIGGEAPHLEEWIVRGH